MYVNVYLKRIYFAVYKLFLHNPDLKQMNKTKELNWKQGKTQESQAKAWYIPWKLCSIFFIVDNAEL